MSATSMPRRRRSASGFGLSTSLVGIITLKVISSLAFLPVASAEQLAAEQKSDWIEALRQVLKLEPECVPQKSFDAVANHGVATSPADGEAEP